MSLSSQDELLALLREASVGSVGPVEEEEEAALELELELARTAYVGAAREELAAVQAELFRRIHVNDPARWAADRLHSFLWSKQKQILESVRDYRKTAVRSCHGPGKSFTAAAATSWWLSIHKPGEAFVVTSAPTGRQVRAILWREIGRAHGRGQLTGRTNQTEWWMRVPNGKEELVAFGQKPADMDPTAFQGIHARYVLVILDEACGIPEQLFIAADSLLTNDDCRILAEGNPDDPSTTFAEICKPGSGWNTIAVSAFDTPNFTGEAVPADLGKRLVGRTWVEEKRSKWAKKWTWTSDGKKCVPPKGEKPEDMHPLWASKVLGQFPIHSDAAGLIPPSWLAAAQERSLPPGEPNELGVDVGAGGDSSTTCHRQGDVFRIISEDRNPNTMQTCGKVVAERKSTGASCAKVDTIGIGRGVVDRGQELGEPFLPVNVGDSPSCNCLKTEKRLPVHDKECNVEVFSNFRAQAWWQLRERFEEGRADLDPEDEDTVAELCTVRYRRLSNGKIQIESKDEAKRRGIPSPNRAEALMLASVVLPEPKPKKKGGLLF
jgi:hypothetical protein